MEQEKQNTKDEILQKRIAALNVELGPLLTKHKFALGGELVYSSTGILARAVVVDIKGREEKPKESKIVEG